VGPYLSERQWGTVQVSQQLAVRLARIFLRDGEGHRPIYAGMAKFRTDPH